MASTTTTGRNQALGAYGEAVAARHLAEQGMALLDRNWRCDEGELDLVLRDGDALVVCEVKTRTSLEHGSPHEAVTPEKLSRLVRLGVAEEVSVRKFHGPAIAASLERLLSSRSVATKCRDYASRCNGPASLAAACDVLEELLPSAVAR